MGDTSMNEQLTHNNEQRAAWFMERYWSRLCDKHRERLWVKLKDEWDETGSVESGLKMLGFAMMVEMELREKELE
jgi:hypothetical protein